MCRACTRWVHCRPLEAIATQRKHPKVGKRVDDARVLGLEGTRGRCLLEGGKEAAHLQPAHACARAEGRLR